MAAMAMSAGAEVLHLADGTPPSPKQTAVVVLRPSSPKPIAATVFGPAFSPDNSRPTSVVITTATSVRRGSQTFAAVMGGPPSPRSVSAPFAPASRFQVPGGGRRALHRASSHNSVNDDAFSFMSDRQILADLAARRYDAQRITRKAKPPSEPMWTGGGRGGAGRRAPMKPSKSEPEKALHAGMGGVSLFDILGDDEEPKKEKLLLRMWHLVSPRRVVRRDRPGSERRR